MTVKDSEFVVSNQARQSNSPPRRSDSIFGEPRPSQAEVALNAISDILQRYQDDHISQPSDSRINSTDENVIDTDINIDYDAQLIARITAIVRGYHDAKTLSGNETASEDTEEISLKDGPSVLAESSFRVSNTDPDEINKLQLERTTHPEIHMDAYVDTFDTFKNDLLAAARRKKRKQRYSSVQVLLISWEEDATETDLKAKQLNKLIKEEVRMVYGLFTDTLNFDVRQYAIPLVDSEGRDVNWQRKVLLEVNGFVDQHDNTESLLIIYYNGHGSFQQKSCFWHPTKAASEMRTGFRRPDDIQFYGPSLEWNSIQNSISTKGDVLIILDCCYSGASLLDDHSKGRIPTTQILTACSKVQKTPAGPNSFTMKFIEAITNLLAIGRTKIPITELYGVLVGECTPQPFHVQRGPGNIVFEKLFDPNVAAEGRYLGAHEPRSRASSYSSAADGQVFSSTLRPEDAAITDTSSVSSTASLLVTLMVRVKEDAVLSAANWEGILDMLPQEEAAELAGVDVRVEAAMPTNSTILIVSIPLEHWLLLPSNPAYTFLGFVKGHNKLLPLTSKRFSRDSRPNERINSNPLTFHDGEADVIRQLIDAMLSFFQNIPTTSPIHPKSRKAGRFSHMVTKIGIFPSAPKELRSLEDDPHFVTISQLVQKLIVVRNEGGEYEGLSYDLNFTVQRLFELTKKSVKESIRKVGGAGREVGLEEAVTTEFDQLERELLEKLKEEGIVKAPTSYSLAGSGSSKEKEKNRSAKEVVKIARSDGEKAQAVARGGEDEEVPPDDGPLTSRGSTYFNSRSGLLRNHRGLPNMKGENSTPMAYQRPGTRKSFKV